MTLQTQHSNPACGLRPFAGLGFDLSCTVQRSLLLVWRKVEDPKPAWLMFRHQVPVRLHGFALQNMLGRETRGR